VPRSRSTSSCSRFRPDTGSVSGGWDLIIDDDNATSTRYLSDATDQVRDYLDTLDPGTDHSTVQVDVVPEIGDLSDQITESREATAAAAAAQADAAAQIRRVARRLRDEGFSVTDSATLLGVSRGRVSQLLSPKTVTA
jgi:DNA-directed RNA polymerase specialized sigma24 family protein